MQRPRGAAYSRVSTAPVQSPAPGLRCPYSCRVTKHFTKEPDQGRYVLRDGDELLAALDYSTNGHSVSLTRAFTAPAHRGRGLAAEIVEHAVDDLERTSDLSIIPMCWYVGEWFEKHPDRAGLLSR
jgi:predicted GNAT family acetyltransferase